MIVSRYHDISAAHRIVDHPGKCRFIHGHNYRIHFHIEGEITGLGMVVDFAIIKASLCEWLDTMWDHKLLLWDADPLLVDLDALLTKHQTIGNIVAVPFNTTAENMAQYLLDVVGPMVLTEGVALKKVVIEETAKCSVVAENTP